MAGMPGCLAGEQEAARAAKAARQGCLSESCSHNWPRPPKKENPHIKNTHPIICNQRHPDLDMPGIFVDGGMIWKGVHYTFIDAMDDEVLTALARRTGTHRSFWREYAAQHAAELAMFRRQGRDCGPDEIRPITYLDYLDWCRLCGVTPIRLEANQFAWLQWTPAAAVAARAAHPAAPAAHPAAPTAHQPQPADDDNDHDDDDWDAGWGDDGGWVDDGDGGWGERSGDDWRSGCDWHGDRTYWRSGGDWGDGWRRRSGGGWGDGWRRRGTAGAPADSWASWDQNSGQGHGWGWPWGGSGQGAGAPADSSCWASWDQSSGQGNDWGGSGWDGQGKGWGDSGWDGWGSAGSADAPAYSPWWASGGDQSSGEGWDWCGDSQQRRIELEMADNFRREREQQQQQQQQQQEPQQQPPTDSVAPSGPPADSPPRRVAPPEPSAGPGAGSPPHHVAPPGPPVGSPSHRATPEELAAMAAMRKQQLADQAAEQRERVAAARQARAR